MIESITKKSDGVFEEFDVCVSGKHHIFDWKHYDQMIEFLDEVSKDTVNASKYVKAEIKKIKEEEKTDPEKVAEKKKDRRIKTIVSLLIAGFIAGGGISIFYETAKILGEIWHLIGTIFVASVGAGAVSYFGLNEYLKNPRLYELEKDEKELKNDYEIIKDLRRHICLNQMHKTESNDRFSKYNEGKPSLFRRIALIMGSKPETYYEHIVYHKSAKRKIKRINKRIQDSYENEKRYIPENIKRAPLNLKSSNVEQLFRVRKALASENAEKAYKRYKTERKVVTQKYSKQDRYFDTQEFDEAIKTGAADINRLSAIIEEEIAATGNRKELVRYYRALRECLRRNSISDEYENNERRAKRTIRVQLWYLKSLLKERKRLNARKNKLESNSRAYIKEYYM